jgi:FADH2 O2-dependent halogenase
MLHAAIRYGVRYQPQVDVTALKIDGQGVRLEAAGGAVYEAAYVVDAGGGNSPLARLLGLRETPCRFQTHSRAMYTHMVGVRAWDRVAGPPGRHEMARWWAEGTIHHLVDGGWMWIIGFDNHRYSTSPLTSVGLLLDPRRHPPGRSAEDEFRRILKTYPSIGRQFADARPVRPWTDTPRLQYSSTRSTGERWMLLAHAYGFVDPLFSRGITNTMESIHSFVPRFLAARKDGDFSPERFEDINRQQRDMFDNNDELVRHSYMTFPHFPLWNAWNRVWTLGIFYGGARLVRALTKFQADGDLRHLDALDTPHQMRSLAPTLPGFEPLFQDCTAIVRAVHGGELEPQAGADQIFAKLRACPWAPPPFQLGDPEAILTDFRLPNLQKVMAWGAFQAPREVREGFFDFPPWGAVGHVIDRLRSPHRLLLKGELTMGVAEAQG